MAEDFKIHSICVCKNEADIIEHCFREALKWSDYIYVYDGDSTDGTWDVVCNMKDDRVIPWKQDGKVFQESLRSEVVHAFRDRASDGDWWCHLDADEFYVQDPRKFLMGTPSKYHVVWGGSIEYYITPEDVEAVDFSQPIDKVIDALRYYRFDHAEPRFVKHRDRMHWAIDEGWPRHMGLSSPDMIYFKHFKYRTPEQIDRRLATRKDNVDRGFKGWQHARGGTWKDKVMARDKLLLDRQDGTFVGNAATLPDHKGRWHERAVKRIMHGLGVWP